MTTSDSFTQAVDEAFMALDKLRTAIRTNAIPDGRDREMAILVFDARGLVDLVSDVLRMEKW